MSQAVPQGEGRRNKLRFKLVPVNMLCLGSETVNLCWACQKVTLKNQLKWQIGVRAGTGKQMDVILSSVMLQHPGDQQSRWKWGLIQVNSKADLLHHSSARPGTCQKGKLPAQLTLSNIISLSLNSFGPQQSEQILGGDTGMSIHK